MAQYLLNQGAKNNIDMEKNLSNITGKPITILEYMKAKKVPVSQAVIDLVSQHH